jgi:uncharacterized protein YdaU (DUF1376 family)
MPLPERVSGNGEWTPEAYIPFYFGDFFIAVDRLSDSAIVAYQRAIWSYWKDTHCTGLENDDEELKRICHNPDDWFKIKDKLFGDEERHKKFFFLDEKDGKYHQARALEEWKNLVSRRKVRSASGSKGGSKTQANFKQLSSKMKANKAAKMNQSESESDY